MEDTSCLPISTPLLGYHTSIFSNPLSNLHPTSAHHNLRCIPPISTPASLPPRYTAAPPTRTRLAAPTPPIPTRLPQQPQRPTPSPSLSPTIPTPCPPLPPPAPTKNFSPSRHPSPPSNACIAHSPYPRRNSAPERWDVYSSCWLYWQY
jgi:hypothetical protein